jgi:outer membrane protein/adhesin transport system outer membrane protein
MAAVRTFLLVTTIFATSVAGASDLKEALSYAYLNNPSLQSDREDLKDIAERTSQALSGFMPTIKWDRSATRSKSTQNNSGLTGRSYTNTMTIQQELFRGGASLATLKVQKKVFDAQVQALIFNEQKFMSEAINAYLDVLQAKEALDINNNNVEVYKQTLISVEEQFKFGQLTITDVATAKSNLAQAKAGQIKANGDYVNAKASYKVYFNQEVDNPVIPDLPNNMPTTLEALIEEAKINNPNLLNQRASVEASSNNIWATTAGQISPYLTLNASGSKYNNKSSLETSNLRGGYQPNRGSSKQVVLDLTIPIYQGGGEYSKIRQSKIAYQKSQFDASSMMDKVIQNAISAWQGLETQSESLTSYKEQVEAATTALSGARQEFEVGTKTLIDLLKVEQDLFQAKLGLSTAKYNKLNAAFNIYVVSGKLTAKGLALPVEYFDPSKYYLRSWNVLPNVVTSN